MPQFPFLSTDRLNLREIAPTDAADLYSIHGDPERMKWFGSDPLETEDDATNLIQTVASWRALPNPGVRWALERKGLPGLVGTCGLFSWNRSWKKCTLGYELQRSVEGKGLMQEALLAAIPWGFSEMELNRIEALVHRENTASLRLLERLGFFAEGTLRQVCFWGGKFHDMVQLSLLREEWKGGEA